MKQKVWLDQLSNKNANDHSQENKFHCKVNEQKKRESKILKLVPNFNSW